MLELRGAVVDGLRGDCANTFDLVASIQASGSSRFAARHDIFNCGSAVENDEASFVERLKRITLAQICALWLEMTPFNSEEASLGIVTSSLGECLSTYFLLA